MNDDWTIWLLHKETPMFKTSVGHLPDDAQLAHVDVQVSYTAAEHFPVTFHRRLLPWRDVEEIAVFIRGDGSDAQRQALADAILEGRQVAEWRGRHKP